MNKKILVIGSFTIGIIAISPWFLSRIHKGNKLNENKQKLEDDTNDLNEVLFINDYGSVYND